MAAGVPSGSFPNGAQEMPAERALEICMCFVVGPIQPTVKGSWERITTFSTFINLEPPQIWELNFTAEARRRGDVVVWDRSPFKGR